jgi:delta(3,5)-delta(2,4)-dienoyl-CoA isomerase
MSREGYTHFKHFLITSPSSFVIHVQINRPSKLNAFIEPMWIEFGQVFDKLSHDSDVRAIVLSGAGERAFSAGLDVQAASEGGSFTKKGDGARLAVAFRRHVDEFQQCIASVERCEKRMFRSMTVSHYMIGVNYSLAVICVLHGYSFGLALDISTCADIRICASNTKFAVKEVDIGLAADIGTLSRLPKVVGNFSWVKDVALTARTFGADEAYRVGFVSQVHDTKDKALEASLKLAALMATKSPVAVQSTKELLNHSRDHTVADSKLYTDSKQLFLLLTKKACDILGFGMPQQPKQVIWRKRSYLVSRKGHPLSKNYNAYLTTWNCHARLCEACEACIW